MAIEVLAHAVDWDGRVYRGVRSIARVCEWLVPFMAVFYVLGCSVLLVHHVERLPETIRRILTSAFSGQAAVGGFLGTA